MYAGCTGSCVRGTGLRGISVPVVVDLAHVCAELLGLSAVACVPVVEASLLCLVLLVDELPVLRLELRVEPDLAFTGWLISLLTLVVSGGDLPLLRVELR